MLNRKIKQATEAEAKALTKNVVEFRKGAEKKSSAIWLEFAKMVKDCLDRGVPQALSLTADKWYETVLPADEANDALLEAIGLSRSSLYESLGIVRKLGGKVSDEKLVKMGKKNASQLARIADASPKTLEHWAERATKEPTREFKDHVENRITGGEEIYVSQYRTLAYRVQKEIYDAFEEAVEAVAAANGWDTKNEPKLKGKCIEVIAGLIIACDERLLRGEQIEQEQPQAPPPPAKAEKQPARMVPDFVQ